MKKNYPSLFLLLVGSLLFYACNQENNSHLKIIPADAVFVFNIQAKQIFKKSGLDKPQQYQSFQKIITEIDNKLLSKYLENSNETGLKSENFYIFGSSFIPQDTILDEEYIDNYNFSLQVGFSFQMSNENKFETFVGELLKTKDVQLSIEDKTNYKMAKGYDMAILWNDKVALVLANPQPETNYDTFLTLTEEQSIISVTDFQTFQKQKSDIAIWGSYDKILNILPTTMGMNYSSPLLKDIYVHIYTDFNDDEIKVTGRMSPEVKVEEYLAKYPIIKKDFNQSLLADFPKTSYLTYKLSFNIEEYMKLIQSTVVESKDNYATKELLDLFNSPAAKTVINALDGDALLSIYDFARGGFPIPLAGLAFTVKSQEDFNALMTLIPEGMAKQNGDHYALPIGGMVSIYFAYKDKKIYVTNDIEGIANFTGKGFSTKLTNHDLGSELKKSPYLFYLNLDIDSYPEDIRNWASRLGEEVVSQLKIYKDVTIKVTKNNEMEFLLKFKNDNENSLKQLLQSLDNISKL